MLVSLYALSSRGREDSCTSGMWRGRQSTILSDVKFDTDVLAKVHGEPATMFLEDWTGTMKVFKAKYGKDVAGEEIPVQIYSEELEAFFERKSKS